MLRLSPLCLMLVLAALPACSDTDAPDTTTMVDSVAASTTALSDEPAEDAITVVYLGDSLTAGYGLAGGKDQAYPAIIAAKAEELGIDINTVNAGVSGDTSAGGLRRVEWLASRQKIDVLVLALGANDGLRGLPVDALKENLEATIALVRETNPDVRIVLAGMMVPTNMGGAYGLQFGEVYRKVAAEEDVALVPFLLDGVGGIRALNQADGVHPTAEGQRIMAETVWETLRPVLDEVRTAS